MTAKRPDSKAAARRAQRARARRRAQLRRLALWLALGVAIAAVVGLLVAAGPGGDDGDRATVEGRAGRGREAPVVTMADFDGNEVALASYRGTPVVLNFWASWCPFCIAEMPDFEKVHSSLDGRVAFVGVDLQDDRGAAERLVKETGVTYDLTVDPDGVVYQAFGGVGMPTTVFIDADGVVRDLVTGPQSEGQLRGLIERHFGITA